MTSPDATADVVRFDSVLVPLDGSDFAAAAIPTARVIAERFGAELRTVSVAADANDVSRLRAAAATALGTAGDDPRVIAVSSSDPADSIIRHATELGQTLICLSTHGRGRVIGAALGSVARNVLQLCGEPVIALGPQAERQDWSPSRRWPPPLSVSRIVACVDGSAESEAVLRPALAWARALGMRLTIATVVEDAPSSLRPQEQSARYAPSGDAQRYIDGLVAQHQQDAEVTVDGTVIKDPISPASGIRSLLSSEPAGLIAVTTHARSGLQRVLLGSAAADIVQASTAPCLVVPLRQ